MQDISEQVRARNRESHKGRGWEKDGNTQIMQSQCAP